MSARARSHTCPSVRTHVHTRPHLRPQGNHVPDTDTPVPTLWSSFHRTAAGLCSVRPCRTSQPDLVCVTVVHPSALAHAYTSSHQPLVQALLATLTLSSPILASPPWDSVPLLRPRPRCRGRPFCMGMRAPCQSGAHP
jgi:hypothetical protein